MLILVLIVLSSMTALSFGLAYRTRIELKLADTNARRVQVYYLALGGVERAKALLAGAELSPQTLPTLCAFTATAAAEKLFEQVPEFAAGADRALSYCVRDEQAYFNVNTSDPAAWENLGVLDRGQIAGILDWIDEDDDTSPSGAESDVYQRRPVPYVAKNGPCAALKELLLVNGVGPELYRGMVLSDLYLPDAGAPDAAQPADPGLLDVFTVWGDGKINFNTAAPFVLAALPGLDQACVDTLLTWRAGADGALGTQDDGVAASADDLANIDELTPQQIELLTEYCCFDSKTFRVFARARVGPHLLCGLMVILAAGQDGPQVLCVERLL